MSENHATELKENSFDTRKVLFMLCGTTLHFRSKLDKTNAMWVDRRPAVAFKGSKSQSNGPCIPSPRILLVPYVLSCLGLGALFWIPCQQRNYLRPKTRAELVSPYLLGCLQLPPLSSHVCPVGQDSLQSARNDKPEGFR